MTKVLRRQGGFTLIEVVAAAALIGIMATMLLPSLSAANDRVKNARLQSDLTTIDQAIALYRMDEGKLPTSLDVLDSEYLSGKLADTKDATGDKLDYKANSAGSSYTLSGKNSKGETIKSPGSSATEVSGE